MRTGQDIRFCTTSDGVRLAMALYGDGPPLVRAANWLTHVQADPSSPHLRHWVEEMSRGRRFVTYDARGCGLSTRNVDEVSLEAWVRDLEAVVDALGLERFPVLGMCQGAATAVAYAARHPERVSRLILFGGYATAYFTSRNPDPRIAEEGETMLKLLELGWGRGGEAFRQVFISRAMPDGDPAWQRAFDAYQGFAATAEMAVRTTRAMYNVDVTREAARVHCPTLVLHCTDDQHVPLGKGRSLAALIPGARFVPLESRNHLLFPHEPAWSRLLQEVRAFLGQDGLPAHGVARLTLRQQEVLARVAAGMTDKQIARALNLSPRTVEMHVAGALKSLDCATRAEAVHRASVAGLLGA